MSATSAIDEAYAALAGVAGLTVAQHVSLRSYNRFGLGGPADLLASTKQADVLAEALSISRRLDLPFYFLGDGSNVIVSDAGYRGLVLRYEADAVELRDGAVYAEVGAPLQALVDFSIAQSLAGIHTLERIPGSVGGAVYGNAGAYGRSLHESVARVRFLDGETVREFNNPGCEFEYRESVFKRRKDWIVLSCALELETGDHAALAKESANIRAIRDEKFPPTMRCAGSIFKNLYFERLPAAAQELVPPAAVRGGKVASAFFLEQVGAKGMRQGGIEIAPYHANVIYNAGGGTAADLRSLIAALKRRVSEQFGFEVEEEVQYVGDA
ncbi:MAG: UDP-N-acetylmuramate dehydrogenase [Acidobacteria bacterium]|nr:UDP-N-acetylmuramate dehydrogenase [Acidobacteriota bacterium]MDA1233835.1 UDP-N-acetylmuramate dehydrogenase [Acidobacteriota bacterium]